MKHYLRFSGRSGRIEFLTTWIGSFAVSSLLTQIVFFIEAFSRQEPKGLWRATVVLITGVPAVALDFLMMWVFYTAIVRRMHDIGLSGWLLLMVIGLVVWLGVAGMLLPDMIVTFFGFLALVLLPGNIGKNAFGERPPLFNGFMEVKQQEEGRNPNDKRIDFKL